MSQGIGALQRAILAHLEQRGSWDTATGIAIAIDPQRRNASSRAALVSVRRAIHGLAARDLVQHGRRFTGHGEWPRRKFKVELTAWLPQHEPPRGFTEPTPTQAEVAALILEELHDGGFRWDDPTAGHFNACYGREKGIPMEPGNVPYEWLTGQLRKRLAAMGFVGDAHDSVSSKATARLAREGKIQRWGQSYIDRSGRRRFRTVYLSRVPE